MLGALDIWTDDATGLRCAVRANTPVEGLTIHCGYVEVPAGHQLYGVGIDDVDDLGISVAFAGMLPGLTETSPWWLGIDDNGYDDLDTVRGWVVGLAAQIARLA